MVDSPTEILLVLFIQTMQTISYAKHLHPIQTSFTHATQNYAVHWNGKWYIQYMCGEFITTMICLDVENLKQFYTI
jgi:hypothetical protein